ncbi:hypothetical protein Syun_012847 [Stephania yunnanensis]|uniref:Uncharacterized protein n=1 Tax=Stephania yunnanensis TaxID=152371 RepID=A0AAP0K2I7_9MAGN
MYLESYDSSIQIPIRFNQTFNDSLMIHDSNKLGGEISLTLRCKLGYSLQTS